MAGKVEQALPPSDGPSESEELMPLTWTYVAFALDPVGTLAYLGDDEATRAAGSLQTKKYVGLVQHVCNWILLSAIN